jgi:hypothetical protein
MLVGSGGYRCGSTIPRSTPASPITAQYREPDSLVETSITPSSVVGAM